MSINIVLVILVTFFATVLAAIDLDLADFEALVGAFVVPVLTFPSAFAPAGNSVGTPPANANVEKLNMLGMIIHLIGLSIIAGSLSFAHCDCCMI